MIPENKWEWYGHPLHFIGSWGCTFRMGTKVGKYVISTVGGYRPVKGAKNKKDNKAQEIGLGRLYETMVFKAGRNESCGCPSIKPRELDSAGYNDAAAARKGHMKMCREWAAMQ